MKYQHKITTDMYNGISLIAVEGDLTSDADIEMKEAFQSLRGESSLKKLIINFEKTKYINSSGIATLINIIQDMNESDGKIAFVGMSDHLVKVMDIVGISDFVKICKTNDDAQSLF